VPRDCLFAVGLAAACRRLFIRSDSKAAPRIRAAHENIRTPLAITSSSDTDRFPPMREVFATPLMVQAPPDEQDLHGEVIAR
jgi:hypothetical protein